MSSCPLRGGSIFEPRAQLPVCKQTYPSVSRYTRHLPGTTTNSYRTDVRTYVRTESAIKKADFGVENGQIKDDGAGIRVECGAVYSSSIETTMDLIEGA